MYYYSLLFCSCQCRSGPNRVSKHATNEVALIYEFNNESEVIWIDSIRIQNFQTVGGE